MTRRQIIAKPISRRNNATLGSDFYRVNLVEMNCQKESADIKSFALSNGVQKQTDTSFGVLKRVFDFPDILELAGLFFLLFVDLVLKVEELLA